MQKPKGYEEASRETFKKLEKGAYVCNIKKAEESVARESGKPMLRVAIDIAEGEFKGYYKEKYDWMLKSNPDSKWKGIAMTMVELDNGDTHPNFKNFVECVKESNAGYEPTWGDNFCEGLKGKKVGVVFHNKEWNFNGRSGWTVQPEFGHFIPVSKVNDYDVSSIKDVPLDRLKVETAPAYQNDTTGGIPDGFEVIPEDDVPF